MFTLHYLSIYVKLLILIQSVLSLLMNGGDKSCPTDKFKNMLIYSLDICYPQGLVVCSPDRFSG